MGSCLTRTRLEKYNDYFEKLQLGELNDLWSTVRIYKIKQLFAKHASSTTNSLDFNGFRELLPGLQIYSNDTVRRIFEIFDRDERELLNFSNFLRGLSICNYAPEDTMLAIMFMMYDQVLERTLKRPDLVELFKDNRKFLLDPDLYDSADDFTKELMDPKQLELDVDQFVNRCRDKQMFNTEEYKRIYSVFMEERIEKELAVNFSSWNKLFNTEEQRFVSYVLSYKWFEAWRIYAEEHYKLIIDIEQKNLPSKRKTQFQSKTKINTLKTIKTVTNLKNEVKTTCKTLNFVHGDIGERPREIYNNVLEGEYEGILNSSLASYDYILVSEKVWNYFHMIYEGGPAFRRTGVDQIEMEPKLVKIYSSMFRDKLDYSSEVVRQVPCSISPFEILTQSIEIPESQLVNYVFFSKIIGGRWEKIPDLYATLEELHSEVTIFLVYLPVDQELAFVNSHVNIKTSLNNINIGDIVIIGKKEQPKRQVVFMGMNNQGKMILHQVNQNYKLDFCVQDKEFKALVAAQETEQQLVKNQQRRQSQSALPVGLKTTNANSFISSLMPILREISEFGNLIKDAQISIGNENVNPTPSKGKTEALPKVQTDGSLVPRGATGEGQTTVTGELSTLLTKMSSSRRVSARNLKNVLNICLPQAKNNEETFINSLFFQIDSELRKPGAIANPIQDLVGLQVKSVNECPGCHVKTEKVENPFGITLTLPPDEELTYKVTYVPYCHSMSSTDIKKYAFKLHKGAKLKEYKAKLEETIGFNNKNYLLAEVYHNNIIKNFSTAEQNEKLDKLHLREADEIFCYDLHLDFQSFVKEHYRTNRQIELEDIKVNHFIDCNNQDQGWIFGKVCSVQYLTYTKRTIVSVIHKINRSQEWKIGYDLFEVALFPTQSYQNCEQFMLRVNQRRFNESTNNMENIGIPLVVTLPEWMRWKEFFFLMYLQMKKFISDEQSFEDEEYEPRPATTAKSSRTIKDLDKKPTKAEQKKKLNKFKEYISSEHFPYKLTLVDLEGRCSICFRFVKDAVYKGEGDTFCTGCKISESDPISWQVKCTEIMVCVDWKKAAKSKLDEEVVRIHPSLANLSGTNQKQTVGLRDCIEAYFKPKVPLKQESECCQKHMSLTRVIEKSPQYLFITLNRAIEIESFRRLSDKLVLYEQQVSLSCKRGNQNYELFGVLFYEGQNRYCSITCNSKGQILEYNGDSVTPSSKKEMLNRRAHILVYKLHN